MPSPSKTVLLIDKCTGNVIATPSNHRNQFGPPSQPVANRIGAGGLRDPASTTNGGSQIQTPAHRLPLASLNVNSGSKNRLSGYGMSAGIKIGRQQGKRETLWTSTLIFTIADTYPILSGSRLAEGVHSSQAHPGDGPSHHPSQSQQVQRDGGAYY